MREPVYILGGSQTDFAFNWSRAGYGIFDMLKASVEAALEETAVAPAEIEVAHIGNFVAELFCGQGHLGGMFASIHPDLGGLPAARHEAACASGSIALLAAAAEIEAGRYDVACVSGVEQMKNVDGLRAAENLGAAMWVGAEAQDAQFPWPYQFSQIADFYDERYGLRYEHLMRIAQINFGNARRNPNAQTRRWTFTERSFMADDEANPPIEGRLRKQDCGQITDGAATVLLASRRFAENWARRNGRALAGVPVIQGWGHRTAPLKLADKLEYGRAGTYAFPHLRRAITDAYGRARIQGPADLDGIETHDCFTITEYLAIDHFGITSPGQSWQAIEDGTIELEGRLPINASGGLIGCGHPVGATGVRMLLDAAQQVTGTAGDCQIEGARRVATLNIGGSATTVVSFIVGTAS